MGSVVFAKSPGPTDQRKSIRLSSLVHDLFLCWISVFGSVCLQATECGGKSEETFQRQRLSGGSCGGSTCEGKISENRKNELDHFMF